MGQLEEEGGPGGSESAFHPKAISERGRASRWARLRGAVSGCRSKRRSTHIRSVRPMDE